MTLGGSTLSRRVSEVLGVALFGAALIWLVALASYEPNDPVWFFSTGAEAPANFVGRVGAFLAELSFQIVGYGSYLLPAIVAVAGWHYFWCRRVEAIYTKVTGAVLVAGVHVPRSWPSRSEASSVGDRAFRAGGYVGEFLAGVLAEYLSRFGSIIVILTLLVVAVILATQFSFGRLFSVLFTAAGRARSASRGPGSARAWPSGARSASAAR